MTRGTVVGWAPQRDTDSARVGWWGTVGNVLPCTRRGQAESRPSRLRMTLRASRRGWRGTAVVQQRNLPYLKTSRKKRASFPCDALDRIHASQDVFAQILDSENREGPPFLHGIGQDSNHLMGHRGPLFSYERQQFPVQGIRDTLGFQGRHLILGFSLTTEEYLQSVDTHPLSLQVSPCPVHTTFSL